jgi:ubiquinone/menaquinone biosynthesis C-methylase UbiE
MSADIKRLRANQEYGAYDLVEWIRDIIKPRRSEKILDLGCGTGEQLIRLSENLGPASSSVGVDKSRRGIDVFRKSLTLKRRSDVKAIYGDIQDFRKHTGDSLFDICMSNFAFYYVKKKAQVMDEIGKVLSEKGRFFVSGPMCHNNYELIQLHSSVVGTTPDRYYPRFMEEEILPLMRKKFSNVSTSVFRNPITFPSAESLVEYWKNYYLFRPESESDFAKAVGRIFKAQKVFVTVKEVIGILATAK